MATTLQQLLDELTTRAAAPTPTAAIEDVTGALTHLGRALTELTHDGLSEGRSSRQHTAAELGTACTTVGGLWPRTGGPLTDLAGAAADLIGRDSAIMGRSHRWAVTVELAEATDHCAQLAHRLLPQAAVVELTAVRRLAAAVEHDAQTDPPTASGFAVLDRLVPTSGASRHTSNVTALDASAALVAALGRAQRTDELSLRDFRATVAAAEITSRYAAAVTAARTGGEAGPPLVAAAVWQLTGRSSMVFEDGRRSRPPDAHGVIPSARALAGILRADVGSDVDIATLRDRDELAGVASSVQQVTNQLPLLAEQLTMAVDHWSRTGQLYAKARDLPPMDNMPEDRVREVVAGRTVQARGRDLTALAHVVGRAGALSTALADALNRAGSPGAPAQRHLANLYAQRVRAHDGPQRALAHAQDVERAAAANRPRDPLLRSPGDPAPPHR